MSDSNKITEAKKPDVYIFTKVANGYNSRLGARIGRGYYHKDGRGLNIFLEAVPIPLQNSGMVELTAFPPKEEE